MNIKIEALGYSKSIDDLDEGSVAKSLGEIESLITPLVNENAEYSKEADELKAANGGEKVTPELIKNLTEQAKAGKKYIDYLVGETNKYKVLLGLVENNEEAVNADKEFLKTLTPDQIQSQLDQFKSRWEKDHPPDSKTAENTDETSKKKDDKKIEVTCSQKY